MSKAQKPDTIEGHVETEQERIARLKVEYLEYYRELPVQKLAAASVGRTDDTIVAWRNADKEFSEQVQQARAAWALRKTKRVDETWLLERVLREEFPPRLDVVVTNQDKTLEQLIAEAQLRGIDTSSYERLIAPSTDTDSPSDTRPADGQAGAPGEDPAGGPAVPAGDGTAG
jgi:hypothetical protein